MGVSHLFLGILGILVAVAAQKPLCRERFSLRTDEWRDCRVQVGGLAIQGAEAFLRTYGPTFSGYLTESLNVSYGLEFEALPLNFNENFDYVGSNSLDYIYSNPAAYTCMMVEFNIATIASMMNFRKGNALDRFAGVIFSRVDSNFSSIADVKQAKVAAVSISGLGAMQLQQAELLELGINIMTDVKQITFTGNQNLIVQEVEQGWADVGFVRTDMIDRSVDAGRTRWEYFQVINQKHGDSFPFRRSTQFTPEWPIGALPHVPPEVSELVGQALMRLDRDSQDPLLSEPAHAGSFSTWVPPMNYFPLLSMLENIGYYSPSQRKCLRAADVLAAVNCPVGYVKQRPEQAFCPPEQCKDSYTCLCQPCVKLKDPELVLTVEKVPRQWNANLNGSAIDARTRLQPNCSRMSICASIARGQSVRWTLLDQIGDAVREQINQYRLQSVEVLDELEGTWQALTRESVVVDGVNTEQYVLNTSFDANGFSVVQLRINGAQAALSPVVVEVFEPIEQFVNCPSGHKMELDGSCSPCPVGFFGGMVTDSSTGILRPVCLPCARGTYQDQPAQAACRRCSVGTITDTTGRANCTRCPAGYSTLDEEGASLCTPCKAGEKAVIEEGVTLCSPCPAGTYTDQPGQTKCLECAPGTFSSVEGSLRCLPCPPGAIAAGSRSEECQPCSRGFYTLGQKNGATSCLACSMGMTTLELGSVNESYCLCPAGFFLRPGLGCKDCADLDGGEGINCPGGNGPPLQVKGYWVDVVDEASREYSVHKCRDTLECPEGPLSVCAAGREGQACNDCIAGYVGTSMGECKECGSLDVLPFVVAAFVLVFALGSLVIMVDADRCQQSLSRLTVLMVFGQVVMAVQALGAISQLSVNWIEPVRTILSVMQLVTLDFDLLQLPCLFRSDSPIMKFALQLLAYPLFATVLLTIVSFFRLIHYRRVSFDSIFNLNGILLFMLFITLTLTVLMPFQCAPNPNGTTYLAANPGITCWDSYEHWVLVGAASLGTLMYPLAILSWTMWTTIKYPHRISSGTGLKLIQRHRFLFERFTVERYYFGVVLLLRNTFVALVPVIFVAFPVAQLVAMGFVLLTGLAIQSRLWPWRTEGSNLADLGAVCCLVMVLITCAPLVSVDVEDSEILLSVCLCITIIGSVACGVATILHGLYRRIRPFQLYDAFLCHHKAGAGCLCRFIKFSLIKLADCRVFLDSDNLEDLDMLFDIVRCNCKNLVVILSPDLMKRIWCAGEIVTAHRNHVRIIPVRCDGFCPLRPNDFELVEMFWSDEEKHMLANYGISIAQVVEAYKYLQDQPFLKLMRSASHEDQEQVLLELIGSCKMSKRSLADTTTHTGQPKIAVIGAFEDVEALATCQIVEVIVQRNTFAETMVVRTPEQAQKAFHSLVYVAVVLTRGVLMDPQFVSVLQVLGQGAHTNTKEFVIINADPRFEFPNSEFYNRLSDGDTSHGVSPDIGPWLAETYRALFCVLALPLSPQGSESLLCQQLDEVCHRFRRLGAVRKNSLDKDVEEAVVKRHSSMPSSGSRVPVRGTLSRGSHGSGGSRGSGSMEGASPAVGKTSSASSGGSVMEVVDARMARQASPSPSPFSEANVEVGAVSSRQLRVSSRAMSENKSEKREESPPPCEKADGPSCSSERFKLKVIGKVSL